MWVQTISQKTTTKMYRQENMQTHALPEAVARMCSVKEVLLEILQNSQENICTRVSFLIKFQAEACNFIKKETLARVFSCEFCEISKNTFFIEHLRWFLQLSLHNELPDVSIFYS